jgi:8-oxo-dGTP diphosphatase
VKEWSVGGGLILGGGGLLMVRNQRRDGSHDWSPPGGVIEPGESIIGGLTREVSEETGVEVLDWEGPAYAVEVEAPDMGWRARIEAHVAGRYQGELRVGDPDGIVVEVAWVELDLCRGHHVGGQRWVREPLEAWLEAACRGAGGLAGWEPRTWRYRVAGDRPASAVVTLV